MLSVHKVQGHAVSAVNHQGDAGVVGAQAVDGVHVLLPPDAHAPLGGAHPADVDVVVLGPAHQGFRVKPGGGAEQPVVLGHVLIAVAPGKAQVHGGELVLADASHPGGEGVVYHIQSLPGGKAQHAHALGQGELHIAQGAGGSLPGGLDIGQGESFLVHGKSLVFLFHSQAPAEQVAAAGAAEVRPEAFVFQVPAGEAAALLAALGAGKAQVAFLHQGAVNIADIGGLKGDPAVELPVAAVDIGGDGPAVVHLAQNGQGHAAVVQRPVVVHTGDVQPQQLRRPGEAHLLPPPQAHAVLGEHLQIAIAGQEGHVLVAAEIPAILNER